MGISPREVPKKRFLKFIAGKLSPLSNKSGASNQVITLPKGGGALSGIGETFSPDLHTGTGNFTVPIALPPGRNGFKPEANLIFSTGNGNGPFGLGWGLSLPGVSRKTSQGVPRYRDDSSDLEDGDIFILSGAEDLVPVAASQSTTRYQPRTEGLFARIERWTNVTSGEIHWRSISKDNVISLYGRTNNSRIFDPEDDNPDHPTRIFSWLLCETLDHKGNAILYEYKEEDGAGVDLSKAHERNRGDLNDKRRAVNRYIKRIYYGNRETTLDKVTGERPL